MSQQGEETASEHHGFDIVINGEPFTLTSAVATYDEVVNLVFPGGSTDSNYSFRVDYEDAARHKSGALVEGQHVEVERTGTEFSVIRSVRS